MTRSQIHPYYKSIGALILLSLLASFFVYFPVTDTDIWWHLTAAREMLHQKSLLYTDPFAYTIDHPAWINLHWLFQLAMYMLYSITGAGGIVLAKCLAVAITSVLLSLAIPDDRYLVIAATVFTLLVYEARYLVCERPMMVTMLCIALYIWAFESYSLTKKKTYLWFLLPVQIIWTNSQGLFVLGIGIAGCYVLGEIMQRTMYFAKMRIFSRISPVKIVPVDLVCVFCCIAASCFVNPYGLEGLLFPIRLLGRINPALNNVFAYNISENLPLLQLNGWETHYLYTVILSAVVTLATFWLNKHSFRWAHALIFGIFLWLAFMAQRNVLIYFLVLPCIIGYNCIYCYEKGSDKSLLWLAKATGRLAIFRTAIKSIIIVILLMCVIQHARVVALYPKKSSVSPFRVPQRAVEFLKKYPVEGKMFNSIRYGGYCMWHLYPTKQVFIDGRLIIRSQQFFMEYLSILDNPDRFPTVASCFGISHAILPTAIFNRYLPLVKWLHESPQWDCVMADGGSILFIRHDINTAPVLNLNFISSVEIARKKIRQQWKDDPAIQEEAIGYFNTLVAYLNR